LRNNTLFAAAVLLAGTGIGHADILASGMLTAGGDVGTSMIQNTASCTLFNTGPTAVDVTSASIVRQDGAVNFELVVNNCGRSIAAGQGCLIRARITRPNSYACVITTRGDDSAVRGALQFGNGTTPALVALPLQASQGQRFIEIR
jgi:hypothetical protein